MFSTQRWQISAFRSLPAGSTHWSLTGAEIRRRSAENIYVNLPRPEIGNFKFGFEFKRTLFKILIEKFKSLARTKLKSLTDEMNEIEWDFLFAIVHYRGILLTDWSRLFKTGNSHYVLQNIVHFWKRVSTFLFKICSKCAVGGATTVSLTIKERDTQHNSAHNCYGECSYVECRFCWESQITPLCWVSLC